MSYFKNVMIVLPLLFSLFSLQIGIVSANSLTSCPGDPITLHWWSGNVDNCSVATTGTTNGVIDSIPANKCLFTETPNVELSSTVILHENQTCSVVFTCTPADPTTADLTIVNSQSCCGTFDNTTNTIWEPTINNCVLPLSVGTPTPSPSSNILPDTQFTVTFPIINGGAQATRTVVSDSETFVSTAAGGGGTTCELLDSTQSVVLETVSCNGATGSITSNTPATVTGNDYGYFVRVSKGGQSVVSSMFVVSAYPPTEVTISQSSQESVVSDTSGAYTITWTSLPPQNQFGKPTSCEIRKTDTSGTTLWPGLTELNKYDGSAVEIAERIGNQRFEITCNGPGGLATAEVNHIATPPLGISKPADKVIVLPTLDFSVNVSLTNNGPFFGIPGATCTLLDYKGEDTLGPDATFPCATSVTFPWQLNSGAAAGTYGFYVRAVKGSQTVRSPKFTVTAVPHTSVSLSQSPTTIIGEEYTIGWTTLGAPSTCTLTKPDGTELIVSPTGGNIPETQSTVGDYTYSIICDGPGLVDTDVITHRVNPRPIVPTCGSASQPDQPLLFIPDESVRNDPSTVAPADSSNSNRYSPESLCANGRYINTAETKNENEYIMSWNWSCEGVDGNTSVVSCSVPNWGCTEVENTNYKPNGPNNKYLCSAKCNFGFNWDVPSQSCIPAPRTVAELSQTTSETAVGVPYRIIWSSSGDSPTTCKIRRSVNTSGTFVPDPTLWSTNSSGDVTERPVVEGTYRYLLECDGPGGPASKTVDHVVAKLLSITAPPNQTLIYPDTTFIATSTIINGGLGATCKLVAPKAGDDTLGGISVPCEGGIASVTGSYPVGAQTRFPTFPQYRISVTKGSQTAVSPLFTVTIVSPASVSLTQSSLASVVNTTYDVRWVASSTLNSCILDESLRAVGGSTFIPKSSIVVGTTGRVDRTPKTGEEGTRRFTINCSGSHGEVASKSIDHVIDPRVLVSTPPDQTLVQTGGSPNKTFTATFSITNGGGGTICALADGNGNEITGTSKSCTGTTGSITYTILTNDIDYQYRIIVKKPSQNVSSGAFKVRLRPPTTVTFTQSSSVTVVNSPFDLTWRATPLVPLTSFDPRTTCTLTKGIGAGPDTTTDVGIDSTQQEVPTVAGDYHYSVTCTGVGGTVVSSLNHRVNDGLGIAPIATTTIVLPTTAFSVRAYIANGGVGTTCRLLDYQGTPIGSSINCSDPNISTNGISISGVNPSSPSSYLYFIEAKNGGQTVVQPFVVTTLAQTTVTLSQSSPATIEGESYTISWTVTGNPQTCRLTKPSTPAQIVSEKGASISETKSSDGNYTYSITCDGLGGTDSDSITHRVNNPPSVDTCGTVHGTEPLASEPALTATTSTLYSLCSSGTYINTPADTINGVGQTMTWRWSCGTVATSCSAPAYGCTDPNDINYKENGPNNRYGCANKCNFQYIFDAVNNICVSAPQTTVTFTQTTPSSTLGNKYTLIWSSTGLELDCAISTSGPTSSFINVDPSGRLDFDPSTTGTYNHTLTCTGSGGPASKSLSHDVYLPLSLTTPPSLTTTYSSASSASFQINFDVLNGGAGTTCTLLDYQQKPIAGVPSFSCTNTGGVDTLYTVNTGLTSFGGENGYYILAQKGTLIATSSKFTLTLNPQITTYLTQSTSTTIANDPGYVITWSSTPIQGAFGAPRSCELIRRVDLFGDGLGYIQDLTTYSTNFFDSVIEKPQQQGTYHFRLTCIRDDGVSSMKEFYHEVVGALAVPTPINQTQLHPSTRFTIPLTIQNGGATTKCTVLNFVGAPISAPELCEGGVANIIIDAPTDAAGGIYGYKILVQKGSQSVTTPTFNLTVNPIIGVTISQSTPTTFIGTPFTISWSSTPASGFGRPTTCSITKSANTGGGFGVGVVWSTDEFTSNGPVTETIGIVGSYRYVLSCTGPGGTASGQITHTVNENDTCGIASSPSEPLESETVLVASSTGIAQLCTSGAYSDTPADIAASKLQKWVWSCGTASCSAPKYGCTALHNINYDANGPQNKYRCSATCDYGYNWNTTTLTCDPAPDTTVTINQTVSQTIVGVPYTVTWSSGGNPESCSITKTQSDGSVQNNWATGVSGSKVETPTGAITYQDFTITCNGPGGEKSASIHHIVEPVLSVNTPPNQTIALPNRAFSTTFTVTNGGLGTTCSIGDFAGTPLIPFSPCIGAGNTSPYSVTLSHQTPSNAFTYGYRIIVAKSGQSATSSIFTIKVDPQPVCGPADSSPIPTPTSTQPTGVLACTLGAFVVAPQTLTAGLQAWNWTCGGTASCSAPKLGCRITTDSNFDLPEYGIAGPNNNDGCANTCENGSVQASYPGCNACTPPLVFDPTASGSACVQSLSVVATGETSIVLPETDFTLSYTITNGTGNSDTQCRLVGTDGTNFIPVSGAAGIYDDCTSTLSGDTPSTLVTAPTGYGYYVQVKKGSQEVVSNKITITVIPVPDCGDINGIPQLIAPVGGAAACDQGAFVLQPQTTTEGAQEWNWTCGGVASCSAPLFGCRITTDSNFDLPQYGDTGPDNNWGCAGTCENNAITASYPSCNACPANSVFDPTASGNSCILPLGINTIPNQTIQAPNTIFTVTYTLINGNASNSSCRLLGTDGGGNYFPLTATSSCDGNITWDTPNATTSGLFGGVYGYRVEVKKGSQVIQSNGFTVTVLPIAPVATFTNFMLRCDNSDRYEVAFEGKKIFSGDVDDEDFEGVLVPHTKVGTYTAVCSRGTLLSQPKSLTYTGTLTLSGSPCTIPVGFAACELPASWTSVGAASIDLIDRNTSEVLSTSINSTPGFKVTAHHDGTNFDLRDSSNDDFILDTKSASGVCVSGSEWIVNEPGWTNNPVNLCLERPVLQAFTVIGQFTNGGVLRLICQRSTHYEIQKEASIGSANWISATGGEQPYTGTVNLPVGSQSGDATNYKAKCINGPLSAGGEENIPKFTATPITVQYKKTPPPSAVTLNAAPRTLSVGSETTLSWTINYPTSACTIHAQPVCTGTCNQAQNLASTTVNTALRTGATDDDDPSGRSRSILNSMKDLVEDVTVFPWQAKGKKSITVFNSMDFEIKCGPGPTESARVRVIVTGSSEG